MQNYINQISIRHILLNFIVGVCCFASSCVKDEGKINPNVSSEESYVTQTAKVESESTPTTQTNNSHKEGLEVGDIAWNLDLKDSTGVFLSLSSLRGKIVLVDFWATWCKPCRIENDKLRKVYSKYTDTSFNKAKGFEVYMVSVFDKVEIWKKRLTVEKYNWKYQLIDDGGTAKSRYNVQAIPMNFLLDGNGIIIAKNLRDTSVEHALKQLIK